MGLSIQNFKNNLVMVFNFPMTCKLVKNDECLVRQLLLVDIHVDILYYKPLIQFMTWIYMQTHSELFFIMWTHTRQVLRTKDRKKPLSFLFLRTMATLPTPPPDVLLWVTKPETAASPLRATQTGQSAVEAKYLTLRMNSQWLMALFLSEDKME